MRAIIIILISFSALCFSQNAYKYNYFVKDYDYLDKGFNIKITSSKFNELVVKYKFIPDRIRSYKDSLSVILSYEFKGQRDLIRVGALRLGYTWRRLGYHLWLKEKEVKLIANKLSIKHPYKLKQAFLTKSNKINIISDEIVNLKYKLRKSNLKSDFNNVGELLNYALLKNPKRIEDFAKYSYELRHGKQPPKNQTIGKSCGKKNCCQL